MGSSAVESVGGVAGGWLSGVSGLLGGAASIFNNERNIAFSKEAQDYSKWLNERTWEREDSAVQRRVADLRRAGLSPVLAAGSSAQTGSPIKIDPVQSQDALGAEGFMSGATKAAQTQQSLMAAEAARSTIELNQANVVKAKAQAAMAGTMAAQVTKEWGLDGGTPFLHGKYNSSLMKDIRSIVQELRAAGVIGGKKVNVGTPESPKLKSNPKSLTYTEKEGQLVPQLDWGQLWENMTK